MADPLRPDADRLRADLQRALLGSGARPDPAVAGSTPQAAR
jgi:hypothetical protein